MERYDTATLSQTVMYITYISMNRTVC
jgi:hypothetical protein